MTQEEFVDFLRVSRAEITLPYEDFEKLHDIIEGQRPNGWPESNLPLEYTYMVIYGITVHLKREKSQ